ncbi:MAG: pilus assembly protein PilM [Spirochaetes bacterium]|nr:pilus assembly protein PilM [Spirochaetota bacterium]
MFKKIAAIDIGSTSVKIIKAEQKIKSLNIISISSEQIDQSTDRLTAVRNALENSIEKDSFENYSLICNLPTDMIIFRTFEFPFSDPAKIADVIPFEAEEKLPYSIEDTVYDFQFLKSYNNSRILLGAAEAGSFTEFLNIFNELSIRPVYISTDSNALIECYNYFEPGRDNVIQIDFGHAKTTVNYISEKELIFTRSIASGISDIIEMISKLADIPLEDAESMFHNMQMDISNPDKIHDPGLLKSYKITKSKYTKICKNAQDFFLEILTEIKKTEKNISLDYVDIEFREIVISGGGSIVRGIESFIEESLDIKTKRLEFLPQFNDVQIKTRFCTSFGLLLSFLNRNRKGINFLAGTESSRSYSFNLKEYKFPVLLISLSIIIILFTFLTGSLHEIKNNRNNEIELKNQFKKNFQTELKTGSDVLSSAKEIINAGKKELNSIKSILPSDITVIRKIQNITENFENDDTFNLTELIIDEKTIKIIGETGNNQNIDIFKNNLQKSGLYESVTLNTNMSSGKITKFTIQIKLKQ